MAEKELLIKVKGIDELTPVLAKAVASMEASTAKLATSIEKIAPSTGKAGQGADTLNTKFINLASGLSVVKLGIDAARTAWSAISGTINKAISESLQAEQAANRLNGALVSQGLYTKETADQINEYAKALEEQTGVSEESIKNMIAMGVQMGLSVEKSKEMEEAARKLAAATGVDVMTAFSQLQGALNGQSRALAKVIPGVKDLTQAQLKNGEAIDLVNQQLKAQYDLHLRSFGAGMQKAENAVGNIYKALGNIITQNPIVVRGLELFTQTMGHIESAVKKADVWIKENQTSIEKFGTTVLKAAAVVGSILTAIGAVSYGLVGLKAAFAFITGPIGLTIIAISALTAAFYKWPGLFDQIAGSFKVFVGFFLQGISWIAEKTALLVGIFNNDLANSLKNISSDIDAQSDKWKLAGVQQAEIGDQLNKTGQIAEESMQKQNSAIDTNLTKLSEQNAALKDLQKTYGDVSMGTAAQVKSAELAASQRDQELTQFKSWLDNKTRLAITAEEEQQLRIAELKAQALGNSELAFQLQQEQSQMRFELELQQQVERATLLGASTDQINALKEQANLEHLAKMRNDEEQFFNQRAKTLEDSGNDWESSLAKIRASQVKHGAFMGAIQGVQQTNEYKGTQQFLTDLGSLRSSKNKTAFEIGKKAAIAQATINTFMAATAAYSSMAAIPFVGPALGAAAAAAAIAAGVMNIQQISSQKFEAGGQADQGMDSIPGSLAGKSFILSQGERVVQPAANKDLTEFLMKEKLAQNGGAAATASPRGGQNINITLNYNGMGSAADARSMAEILVKEIRTMSERGTPILSERGVVKG